MIASQSPWLFIDFDQAMQTRRHARQIAATTNITGIDGNLLYHSLKGLYNKNNLSHIVPSKELHIPKIIHQIILKNSGGQNMQASLPVQCFDGWQYMLWTEKEIAELTLYNKQYYDQTDNCQIKTDLARLEILYQYGGVCIEPNVEYKRILDILHYTYDFYIGIQPLDSHFLQLGTGIIGSRPGHPILKHSIESIKDDWHEKEQQKKTGSVHLTKSFYIMSDLQGNIDIALPSCYLYPLITGS